MSGLLLKALGHDGRPHHGGSGQWPLPADGNPGAWLEVSGALEPCTNGLHLCTLPNLLNRWLAPTIWLAEWSGERADDDDKVVVRRARLVRQLGWDERTARLYACDCAEHVLPLFECRFPDDRGPREAIAVARRYAAGEATATQLKVAEAAARATARAAAWDAARAAAWAAAGAAAGAAAWDAAWDAARAAAWAVAWAAAWDAARAAAWDAAWAAERTWQLAQLADVLGLTDDERAAVWPEEVRS